MAACPGVLGPKSKVSGFSAPHHARRAFAALESLAPLAESRRPDFEDLPALQSWAAWLARGGARVTVVSAEGRVLVDSNADPARAQDQAELPEIRSALETGEGRA